MIFVILHSQLALNLSWQPAWSEICFFLNVLLNLLLAEYSAGLSAEYSVEEALVNPIVWRGDFYPPPS